MASYGIHFDYGKERSLALNYCIVASVASFVYFILMSFNGCKHKDSNSPIDVVIVIVLRMHLYGSNLHLFVVFMILLRIISIRFAALNLFLR